MLQDLHNSCIPHQHFVLARSQWRRTVQDWTVRRHWLRAETKMLTMAATVVQVLRHLFYVLLHVLFYLWSPLQRRQRLVYNDDPDRSRWAGDNEIATRRLLLLLLRHHWRRRWTFSPLIRHTAYKSSPDRKWNASSRHGSRSAAKAARTRRRKSGRLQSTSTTTCCPISGSYLVASASWRADRPISVKAKP